jgi:5-methyltetrahydrofolate--homocysteine methyltransferase
MDEAIMKDGILRSIREALMRGDRDGVSASVKEAVSKGIEIREIMDDGLIAAMETVGKKFKANEVFIPEVLISAKAMHAGIAILEPHFTSCGIKPVGKVIIGTVKGDLHDIGKNIVSMMFKGGCFEVEDLGIDVPPSKFVESVSSKGADIVAMSSLLTTSMGSMRDTVRAISDAGIREKVSIMVGGAPVTQEFADSIGADGYARDAATAVDVAKKLLKR